MRTAYITEHLLSLPYAAFGEFETLDAGKQVYNALRYKLGNDGACSYTICNGWLHDASFDAKVNPLAGAVVNGEGNGAFSEPQ